MLAIDAKARLKNIKLELAVSDSRAVRGLEDLFQILLRKKILEPSDVPLAVRKTISRRIELRKEMAELIAQHNLK